MKEHAVAGASVVRREHREVFVSYARKDVAFVRRLHERLVESGKKVYVDFRDIPTWSDDWQADLYRQIESSDTVVVVLSRVSAVSNHVQVEVEHAVEQGKRLKPLQLEDVDDLPVPPVLRKPQWIDFRDESRFEDRFAALLEVLNTDVDWTQKHTRFLLDANEWDARGHDRSLLLGRSDLREAEQWLARQAGKDPPPTELHTEFILASRSWAAKRRQILLGAILFALALAIGLAIIALVQRSEAISNEKSARSRELAALAIAELPDDPAASVQMAAQGVRTRDTTEAAAALRTALAESQLRHVLRHRKLTDASFTPDGKRVITASSDGTGRIWDVATGAAKVIPTKTGVIADAAISPDGYVVITKGAGALARIQNAETGEVVADIGRGVGSLVDAAFSPDGTRIVTLDQNGATRVWDVESGRQVARFRSRSTREPVIGVMFSPDGKLVATFTYGLTIRVWDVERRRAGAVFSRHLSLKQAVAFSPDGKLIVTQPLGRPAVVSDARTGGEVTVLQGDIGVTGVAISADGKLVAGGSDDGTAHVWEMRSGKEVGVLRGHTQDVSSAAFNRDGTLIVTSSDDGTARVWEVGDWRQVAVLRGSEPFTHNAAFSRDGRRILTIGEQAASIWDSAAAISLAHIRGITWRSAFSPDGRRLAIAKLDNTVIIRTVLGGKTLATLRGHRDYLTSITFNRDGTHVLTSSADKTARIWRADTGAERATLVGHAKGVTSAAFSPDQELVLTASEDGTARLWRVETGKELAVLDTQISLGGAWFSPDGRRVLTQRYDRAIIWDLDGRRLRVLRGGDTNLSTASFSPDGRHVITASPEGVMRLWDAADGRQLSVLRGPSDVQAAFLGPEQQLLVTNGGVVWDTRTGKIVAKINAQGGSAVVSPDDALILAITNDRSPRLVKATTGEQLAILAGYPDGAVGGSFSPDGTRIIVTGEDGTARVYACRPCGAVTTLLRAADRRPRGG